MISAFTPIDYRGAAKNTVFLLTASIFPAKQQTAPRKPGSKAGEKDEVFRLNLFGFNSFREADGNCAGRGVGVAVNVDSDLTFVEAHFFYRRLDNTQVGLVRDIQLQIGRRQTVPCHDLL